ncbi:MAG: mevalonate kinase [Bdellovibrionales bacterium GWA2_49_15]|nr:MAG: mevalonate kinase [Bdellovibrionales bacterium GWA2_49_15]
MIGPRKFSSKILLFGEYSIIKNSMALATPYRIFEGLLKFRQQEDISKSGVDSELRAFASYLRELKNKKSLLAALDMDTLEFDIGQGLFFESTIPQGFGVGSSGALCASIFDVYQRDKSINQSTNLLILREILGQMEAHFHGASSGLDPLICFLDKPLLLLDKNSIEVATLPVYNHGQGGIFLLNTHRPRRTEPLVHLFLEKCKDRSYQNNELPDLISATNSCIQAFLEGSVGPLIENFKRLSEVQFVSLRPMIPGLFQNLWQKGLEEEKFFLKLCGAGGGGFLLGITRDFKIVREALAGQEFRPIYYF